jgi:O-antigen/teichoic acid export membrane protein
VSLVCGVGGGLVAAGLVSATSAFTETPDRYVWFTIALAPAALFFLLGTNLLIGIGRIRVFNAFEAGSAFAALVALGVAALAGAGIAGLLTASVAAWWAVALGLLWALQRRAHGSLRFNRTTFRSGFRYATKAYVVTLLGFLVLRGNYFLLARLTGPQELGYFSIAGQISDVLALVPTAAAIVIFPNLVRNRAHSWSATLRAARAVGGALIVLCTVTALVAGPFIDIVFGEDYSPAVSMVRWMLPGVLALGLISVISQHVAAAGLPKPIIGIWLAGLAAVIVFGRLLIPPYGGVGAGIAYSASYGLVLVLIFALAVRLRHDVAEPAPATADVIL